MESTLFVLFFLKLFQYYNTIVSYAVDFGNNPSISALMNASSIQVVYLLCVQLPFKYTVKMGLFLQVYTCIPT